MKGNHNAGINGFKKGHKINKGRKHDKKWNDKIKESCRECPVIHHINGNHFDDRPENRIILTPKEHTQIHLLQGDINPYGNEKQLN